MIPDFSSDFCYISAVSATADFNVPMHNFLFLFVWFFLLWHFGFCLFVWVFCLSLQNNTIYETFLAKAGFYPEFPVP